MIANLIFQKIPVMKMLIIVVLTSVVGEPFNSLHPIAVILPNINSNILESCCVGSLANKPSHRSDIDLQEV